MLLRIALRRGTGPMSLTPDAACALETYAWPGNVAELERTLERAAALASGGTIGREHLPALLLAGARPALAGDLATLQYREVLAHARDLLSRDYLVAILRAERGNVKNAASRAGIERESLPRLLKRYGVRADAFRPR
jgi:DNA-binding NtrC family response regulator